MHNPSSLHPLPASLAQARLPAATPSYIKRLNPVADKPFAFVAASNRYNAWYNFDRPFYTATGIAMPLGAKHFVSVMRALRVKAVGASQPQMQRAYQYAMRSGSWPAADSVKILDDGTVVVVLDNTRSGR